ncbi:MAG TPA: hypothetical protein VHV09_25030 [Trebonia sp.]|nr:hypothetical protein [Trebonia sp.]
MTDPDGIAVGHGCPRLAGGARQNRRSPGDPAAPAPARAVTAPAPTAAVGPARDTPADAPGCPG